MLTNSERRVMEAIASNNYNTARSLLLAKCDQEIQEGAESNKRFCSFIRDKLKANPSLMELSPETKRFLLGDGVGIQYDKELFYMTSDEKELLNKVVSMQGAIRKLEALGVRYRNSILLYGPTGCGKTTFVKALAKELDRKLYTVKLTGLVGSLLGETAKNLGIVFQAILDKGSEVILFLDELDAFSCSRGDAGGNKGADGELARTTTALMQMLDMLPPESIVIGATNNMQYLDKATIRRFSVQHEFHNLTQEELGQMVRQYLTTIQRRAGGEAEFSWTEREVDTFVEAAMAEKRSNASVVEVLIQMISSAVIDGRMDLHLDTEGVTLLKDRYI